MPITRPILVYIAGYGRSGSTALDTLLGNHPYVFGAGELTWLYQNALHKEYCSCGAPLSQCPLWQPVLDRVSRDCAVADYRQAAALTLRAQSGKASHAEIARYVRIWRATCQAIVDVSGRQIIVDSSKTCRCAARRLPLLAEHVDIPVKAVHLVRDPRAVMWSIHRGDNVLLEKAGKGKVAGGMARGLLGWIFANLWAERAFRRSPSLPVLRIRYEDFAGNPKQTFERLGSFLGINLQGIVDRVDRGDSFDPGHGVGGNRLRRKTRIALHLDREWQDNLSRAARVLSWIAWPLGKAYGY